MSPILLGPAVMCCSARQRSIKSAKPRSLMHLVDAQKHVVGLFVQIVQAEDLAAAGLLDRSVNGLASMPVT